MAIHLSTPVSALPGIGDKIAKDFHTVEIRSVRDLLWYVPFRYDDFSRVVKIAGAPMDTPITIEATVKSITMRPSKSSRVMIVDAVIEDETGQLNVMWFNQAYLLKTLPVGSCRSFAGLIDHRFKKTFMNPIHEPVGKHVNTGRIVPVYGLTGSMTMRRVRDAMTSALDAAEEISDWLPFEIVEAEKFPPLSTALRSIHFPKSTSELVTAIERFKFDELFLHQLLFEEIRRDRKTKIATSISIDEASLKSFVASLPFHLTRAQKVAAWEIVQDLSKSVPMNRLLEGDVGSGKTVVAAIATKSVTAQKGALVAYLAPTEILAKQQFQSFCGLLKGVHVALLTHSQHKINNDDVKHQEIVEKITSGEMGIVIGTHALLQEGIDFSNLALVIIDEQHRFGVAQRHALLERDPDHAPHLLSMTATPIPRSLALTMYGDLDVSILDELPKGRIPIGTAMVVEAQRTDMWNHVRSEMEKGRQAFVVCPLIDPSDSLGARSVSDVEKMLKKILNGLRVETLHGKLKAEEKQKRNEDFRDGKIDVLISTTVVEVGVDVSNATVMVIMSAERFGLAQLHQLRGRVGRSTHQSYCYLLPDDLTEISKKRLEAVVNSQNGFEIAQIDLELRGAGNVFGNAQSGFPDFQFATPADVPIMKKARDWSQKLLVAPDFLERHPLVRTRISEALDQVHME